MPAQFQGAVEGVTENLPHVHHHDPGNDELRKPEHQDRYPAPLGGHPWYRLDAADGGEEQCAAEQEVPDHQHVRGVFTHGGIEDHFEAKAIDAHHEKRERRPWMRDETQQ